jgi:hypothetical protein
MPPLVVFAAAVLLGAATVLPLEADQRIVVAVGITALAGWLVVPARKAGQFRALVIAALALGAADAWIHESRDHEPHYSQRTARYAGTVLGDVQAPDAAAASFAFGLDGGATVLAQVSGAAPAIGAHLVLRGRLQPFDPPRNPREPDERAIQRERGLHAQLLAAQVVGQLPPAPLDIRIALARAHGWALAQLNPRLPPAAAAIVAGELWGERGALSPELRAEFQETGTVHILITAHFSNAPHAARSRVQRGGNVGVGLCRFQRRPRPFAARGYDGDLCADGARLRRKSAFMERIRSCGDRRRAVRSTGAWNALVCAIV